MNSSGFIFGEDSASAGHYRSLWELAREKEHILRIATLFTAQNVEDFLSDREGLERAVSWCKATGVTHVFLESYRSRCFAGRNVLEKARGYFLSEGFAVSGCVTTTQVGKSSTGWDPISCYTSEKTQQELQCIFEYAASMFDEIMIDDFLFTDCECEECIKARGDLSWAAYRTDLMTRLSYERILKPARAVNPNVRIIIKYPQWYDSFHKRGYDVLRQTKAFDRIWAGTETRDYDDVRWGGTPQYEAYYNMRWLSSIGGSKTGGGWFDPYGTTENTYVEQARQTVLGDAREMLLFCYGSLLENTGPANVSKLRNEMAGLFQLAEIGRGRSIRGIAAPKPAGSDAYDEAYVFDFAGMLGLPLVPAAGIDTDAECAFFSLHALGEPDFGDKLTTMLEAGKPVLMTDGLRQRLDSLGLHRLSYQNLVVLPVGGKPGTLLEMSRERIKSIRDRMLAPLGIQFDAPGKVALYLLGHDYIVLENFNDDVIDVTLCLDGLCDVEKVLVLPGDGSVLLSHDHEKVSLCQMTPRTLVVIRTG